MDNRKLDTGDMMDKCVFVYLDICVYVQQCWYFLEHECEHVFFRFQRGQKHFDHYSEALIYYCSYVSCITHILLTICVFLFSPLPLIIWCSNQNHLQIHPYIQLHTSARTHP